MATTTATAAWGVKYSSTDPAGIVTDITIDEEAVSAQEINEIGQVINVVMYDKHKTVTVTVLVAAITEPPAKGALVTIDATAKGMCSHSEIIESNHDFRKISITLEAWAKFEKQAEDKTA